MKRLMDFFKSKGFYIALGTGVLAFAALMVVYNYNSTKDEVTKQQAIDLNQPAQLDDTPDETLPDMQASDPDTEEGTKQEEIKQAEKEDNDTATAGSDGTITDKEDVAGQTDAEKSTTEEPEEPEVPVISDAAEPEISNEPVIEAGLEYNGEQSLNWPMVGDVILPFSMDTTVYYQTLDAYKCNPGMLIAGEQGASVFAAYEGVVSEVADTKEYGTVVKIDMGNGYEATYGQLMNVRVSEGDTVSIAEMIAEIGPTSSYYTEEGTHLYFEITKDGTPVNPMTLIQ